jgi:hypothetical protein
MPVKLRSGLRSTVVYALLLLAFVGAIFYVLAHFLTRYL